MSSPRIIAAAKALCKLTSKECGVNEAYNWNLNSDMFLKDAAAAIKAADAVKSPPDEGLTTKIKQLQEQLSFYRKKYGVTHV